MKRQLVTNWLLIAAAVGSLVAVVLTRNQVTSGELMQREQNLLQVFDEQAVNRIAMEGTERFEMVRADVGTDEFRLIAPVEERAKVEKVSSLLGSLRFASFLRRVEDPKSDALGLRQPRWVLHVDHGDIHYRLRLGGASVSPPSSSYLEVTGENVPDKGVFVVRDGLVNELSVKLDDFRSHELAAIGQASLARVDFRGAVGEWALKSDSGRWRVAGPPAAPLADRNQVERFFTQLARLKLETFLDIKTARGLVGERPLRISLVPLKASHTPVEIEIGGSCPDQPQWLVAVRSEGTHSAGCVSKEIVEDLSVAPEALRERHLFSLRADEVESFELMHGDGKLALTRSESGFRMTAPSEGDVEAEAAEQLLNDWLAITGEIQPDASAATVGHPRTHIVLRAVSDVAEKYREQRFELGPLVGKAGMIGLRSSDGVVLQLPHVDPALLDVTGLSLRSRAVLNLKASQLTRIEVTTRNVHQVVTQSERGPALSVPQGVEADALLLAELVDALRGLRAVRWVAAGDNGAYGLSDAWARVAFTVAASSDERQDHLLRIGTSTRGGFFAQLDQGPIFVLGRRSAETFSTWLLDRAVFSPPLESAAQIELTSERGKLRLERNGQRFEQVGSQRTLADDDLQALLEELDTLRPETALHLGPALANEGFDKPLLRYVAKRANASMHVAWTIGAADTFRDVPVYFARVDGVDATYVIGRGPILRILDLL
jgi:hypothetical protein